MIGKTGFAFLIGYNYIADPLSFKFFSKRNYNSCSPAYWFYIRDK